MRSPRVHHSFGDGIMCDYENESPNATTEWSIVTCGRCRRLMIGGLRRNIRLFEGWLANGLPPITRDHDYINKGRPHTVEQVVARLDEYREQLRAITEGRS